MKKDSKVLFLDRDGVINVDVGYIWRPEDFIFQEGVFVACRRAIDLGYRLVIITNQAGIGRGIFSEDDFQKLTYWMCKQFSQKGIEITEVFHAPTHPQEGIGVYKRESIDRKPGPGMIIKAQKSFGINLAESAMVGDRESDIEAAISAGVGKKLLIDSSNKNLHTQADITVSSLVEAVDWLEKYE